jgi:hypothetical protein
VRSILSFGGTSSLSKQWGTNYNRYVSFVGTAAPNVFNFFNWPLVRFIVLRDDAGVTQHLKGSYSVYSSDEDLNR